MYPKSIDEVLDYKVVKCVLGMGFTIALLDDGQAVGWGVPSATGKCSVV